ncbi:MAG: phosphate-starvation-inducible PsiE family protein [Erythrobacter sp.]|uniref:phosphate-starvation-inducible PsiE family protein n=1 Tax=Erythrobacter sp. TaxID=1042 RepID=UPI0026251B2E|nr:phosphate-starvation-inducible PsiE family protein [Erythrobacter sp.]MDJ0979392.1 phosphate-starvation-inducible PsiE family protein [Erythrobacter sp.]
MTPDNPPDETALSPKSRDAAAEKLFSWVEKFLLLITTMMTLAAVAVEVASVIERGTIELADLLLMFLYTEVIGMIAVYYTGKGSFFAFPIFIAITAIARLIVLQGKDMAPENVLFDSGAILLLALAAVVISRFRSE